IFMYRPARLGNGIEIWGIPEVQKRFGVERPEQVIDYLGMMGDASDNIPGLPGVGDKTAKKFIEEFGSMENLLANTDKLKGKMKEKIQENAELGILSKKLATIFVDCDVTFDAKDYELSMPDGEKVQEIFEELEFRRLKDQFLKLFSSESDSDSTAESKQESSTSKKQQTEAGGGEFSLFGGDGQVTGGTIKEVSSRKSIKEVSHVYQSIQPGMAMKLFIQNLMKQTSVCFDTETTGLNPLTAELVGIAFSWEAGKGFYVPFPEDREQAQEIVEQLRPFFEAEDIEKIGQNLKYDIKVLHKYNISIKGKCFDTMLAHYLINPDMRHNMDVLAETYLNYTPVSITELIGKKGKNQLSMRDVPLEQQTEYAVEDADITFQLAQHFRPELKEAKTEELFNNIEIPLLHVLADMEQEGINLDKAFLNSLAKDLD
ncbi:MAG: 5'-3' exonuclease H3TH domain-containing protein, partial [Arenibacter sp.]